jgi:DNA-binding MarR family transcriptional regulator
VPGPEAEPSGAFKHREEHSEHGQKAPTPSDLSEAVRRLDISLTDLHIALSRRLRVSQAELMAITHVATAGTLGPSELAHRIDVTTGAVTALLDRLTERGHLERHPHPSDRRRLLVQVTPHAFDEVMQHVMPLAADVRAMAGTFTDGERAAIGSFLEGLNTIVERHAQDESAGDPAAVPGSVPAERESTRDSSANDKEGHHV